MIQTVYAPVNHRRIDARETALSASAAKKGMDQGAPSVTEPRRRTDRYAEYLWFDCFRAHIIWAEKDSIINSEKYTEDRQCHNFPTGSTHTSI